MNTTLFGLEQELAIAARDQGGNWLGAPQAAKELVSRAQRLVHLPGGGSNRFFLSNGSLLYVDFGNHPEVATPECATPWEAVSYLRAGERTIAVLAEEMRGTLDLAEVHVLKSNVDYISGTTWGCHESYLTRRPVVDHSADLIPHLVSRIIYTGSGGLDPTSWGISFSLSPRTAYFSEVVSKESTGDRGIFHTRDEPLCGGYNRLHVIVGDSACSELATWLKVATTACIVALVDEGLKPGYSVQLAAPLEAMHQFATDPGCTEAAALRGRRARSLSATQIQRHYLSIVDAHADKAFMPPWTREVCTRWRQVLDLLDAGPTAVETSLDWTMKRRVFTDRIRRHGFNWDRIDLWTTFLGRLRKDVPMPSDVPRVIGAEYVRWLYATHLPSRRFFMRHNRWMEENDMSWSELDALNDLRDELCALDARFGELTGGIFDALDRSGVLSHRVTAEADIENAMYMPPDRGRARVRGEWVSRLSTGEGYTCEWDRISARGSILNLSDPFLSMGRWREIKREA